MVVVMGRGSERENNEMFFVAAKIRVEGMIGIKLQIYFHFSQVFLLPFFLLFSSSGLIAVCRVIKVLNPD